MLIAIAVGGTGGHVYPGIGLAESLLLELPHCEILFFCVSEGMDSQLISDKFQTVYIPAKSLPRKSLKGLASFIASQLSSVSRAWKVIRERKPDVVIGMGGFGSFPPLLAARLSGVPTVIHEQNSHPGLANRVLGKLVDRVAVSSDGALPFFAKRKTVLTGNPIRAEVTQVYERQEAVEILGIDSTKPLVLIMGGSRGAESINRVALEFSKHESAFQVLHISGNRDYAWVSEEVEKSGQNPYYKLLPYYQNMGLIYSTCDLVVSRAGAGSIAEITARGLPAILIPYPYAAGDHQSSNARHLSKKGAAAMIKDNELDYAILEANINKIFEDKALMTTMEEASGSAGMPSAASNLGKVVISLVKKGN